MTNFLFKALLSVNQTARFALVARVRVLVESPNVVDPCTPSTPWLTLMSPRPLAPTLTSQTSLAFVLVRTKLLPLNTAVGLARTSQRAEPPNVVSPERFTKRRALVWVVRLELMIPPLPMPAP